MYKNLLLLLISITITLPNFSFAATTQTFQAPIKEIAEQVSLLAQAITKQQQQENRIQVIDNKLHIKNAIDETALVKKLLADKVLIDDLKNGRLKVKTFNLRPHNEDKFLTADLIQHYKTIKSNLELILHTDRLPLPIWNKLYFNQIDKTATILDYDTNLRKVTDYLQHVQKKAQKRKPQSKLIYLKHGNAEEVNFHLERVLKLDVPQQNWGESTVQTMRVEDELNFHDFRLRVVRVKENDIGDDNDDAVEIVVRTPTDSRDLEIEEFRSEFIDDYEINVLDVEPSSSIKGYGRARIEVNYRPQKRSEMKTKSRETLEVNLTVGESLAFKYLDLSCVKFDEDSFSGDESQPSVLLIAKAPSETRKMEIEEGRSHFIDNYEIDVRKITLSKADKKEHSANIKVHYIPPVIEDQTQIDSFENIGAILVRSWNPTIFQQMLELVDKFDRPSKHVAFHAIFVEADTNTDFTKVLEMKDLSTSNAVANSEYFKSIELKLQKLEREGEIRIVQNRFLTRENDSSEIDFTLKPETDKPDTYKVNLQCSPIVLESGTIEIDLDFTVTAIKPETEKEKPNSKLSTTLTSRVCGGLARTENGGTIISSSWLWGNPLKKHNKEMFIFLNTKIIPEN